MQTIASPTPSESETPSGKPKAAKKKGKAKAKKSPTPKEEEEEQETPRAKPKKSPSPAASKAKKSEEEPEERRTPTPSAVPRKSEAELPPIPPSQRAPAPTATFSAPPADITIQKSGIEEAQGYEPPPPPPPRRSFWQRLFGGGDRTNYHYLSRNVIDAIRRAPVQRARWKFIIVHNSGTRQGNARAFDYYHRRVRKMQNGLAYHFVVGNGTSSGDGQIEVGDRWRRQINGGHVHSDYLNNISLGICLVGDFNRDQPTPAQLDCCEELIRYLRQRCGKVGDHWPIVKPHRDINPPRWPTDCPGDVFPYSWFRRFLE